MAALELVEIDGILRADIHTGVGDAALTAVCDSDVLLRAGIAGKGDDIDQRLLKILLIRCGVPYPLAQRLPRSVCMKLHSQCKLHSGGYHRPIQENIIPHGSRAIRHQLIRDLIHPGIVPTLISKPGYFPEYTAAGIIDITVYASHLGTSGQKSCFWMKNGDRYLRTDTCLRSRSVLAILLTCSVSSYSGLTTKLTFSGWPVR